MEFKKDPVSVNRRKKFFIFLGILLLLALVIYFFTYFFAKPNNKVIYEKDGKRIYLVDKKEYKKGREMWRMVLENQTTGKRFFILGNSKKGFPNNKMAAIIINTVDQGKMKSYDQVESCGITMRDAKTDIHSNLIDKKNSSELMEGFTGMDFSFPDLDKK